MDAPVSGCFSASSKRSVPRARIELATHGSSDERTTSARIHSETRAPRRLVFGQGHWFPRLAHYHPAMWLVAFFASLVLFIVIGAVLATRSRRYLRLYRDVHGPDALSPWHLRRDGRVTASLLRAFSTRQEIPELERSRLETRRWQVATIGALALALIVGFASQRF